MSEKKELEAVLGLFNNWDHWKTVKYKEIIQKHVKHTSELKAMQSITWEILNFPKEVQKDLEISERPNSTFWLDVGNVFYDEDWWKNITTTEALIVFWRMAHNSIDYFKNNFEEAPKNLSVEWKKTAFGIYQMSTLWIAYNASREKKIRKVIRIKKGFFDF
tara:strand:+ start:126 stop:608 length:483 start_codon:yes stop_codon:yes gene_type:complete